LVQVAELVGGYLVGEADALHGEVEPLRRDQVDAVQAGECLLVVGRELA
jgi:hypothetical protein